MRGSQTALYANAIHSHYRCSCSSCATADSSSSPSVHLRFSPRALATPSIAAPLAHAVPLERLLSSTPDAWLINAEAVPVPRSTLTILSTAREARLMGTRPSRPHGSCGLAWRWDPRRPWARRPRSRVRWPQAPPTTRMLTPRHLGEPVDLHRTAAHENEPRLAVPKAIAGDGPVKHPNS